MAAFDVRDGLRNSGAMAVNVLTAAEALARYAERWPANLAEIHREADAYRERINAQQDAYWIRRDMEKKDA